VEGVGRTGRSSQELFGRGAFVTENNNHTEAGVWCRKCGAITTWTIQSSHAAEGIVRARRCRSCRGVFRSIEIYLSAKHGDVCADYPAIAPRREK
jgi:hypothetical protein